MMTTQTHPLVADYLERLRTESHRLPGEQARELVSDIEVHLAEALSPDADEVQVRQVLDRLGTPGELVDAAGGARVEDGIAAPVGSPAGTGRREAGAIILLVGATLSVIFWPLALVLWLVGLYLLLTAPRWSVGEKILGGLVLGAGRQRCSASSWRPGSRRSTPASTRAAWRPAPPPIRG